MKKLLLTLIVVLFGTKAMAQTLYEVTLQAPVDSQMVFLVNAENHQVLDSIQMLNGQVYFRGVVPEPIVAVLNTKPRVKGNLCTVILDNEPVTLTCNSDGTTTAKGSTLNQRNADFNNTVLEASKGLVDLQKLYMQVLQEHKNIVPDSMMIRLEDMYDHIAENIVAANKAMVEKNRDNIIPLYCLLYSSEDMGYEYVEEYLKTYKYCDRECLKHVKETIDKERCKRPGQPFVDLTMQDLDGNIVKLSDYVGKGKYVLVDFWASWCGPCRKEIPNIRSAYNKYHKKGFQIVSISLDSKFEAWKKGVRDLSMPWPQMSDLKGWESKGAEVYNINSIPATILYDPEGKVIQAGLRGQKLFDRLKEIF